MKRSYIVRLSAFILLASFASVQGATINFNAINGVFRGSDGNVLPDGSPVRVGLFDGSFNFDDIFGFSSMTDLVNSSSFTAYEDLQSGSGPLETDFGGGFASFSVENVPPMATTPFQVVAFHDPGSGLHEWGVFQNPSDTQWQIPFPGIPPSDFVTPDLGDATSALVGQLVPNNGFVDGQLAVVPEPSTFALLGLGGAVLFGFLRHRHRED